MDTLHAADSFHAATFSDILTPLPAMGIPFEIDDKKGPIISDPITSKDQLSKMYPLRLDELQFVGDSLRQLRQRVGDEAAILGFVGSPWTLSTYVVEGGSSAVYSVIKSMMHNAPDLLEALLSFLTDQIAEYIVYQASAEHMWWAGGSDYCVIPLLIAFPEETCTCHFLCHACWATLIGGVGCVLSWACQILGVRCASVAPDT